MIAAGGARSAKDGLSQVIKVLWCENATSDLHLNRLRHVLLKSFLLSVPYCNLRAFNT